MADYHLPTTTITSREIRSVGDANSEFGADKSLVVAFPKEHICCNCPFYFTIPEGFYALVTKFGARVDYNGSPVWPSGLHMGPPWIKVSHLVTKQSMVFKTPVKGCKTKDNVTVQIDMGLVFRIMGDADRDGDDPENVYKFVHEVTAIGLQKQMFDAQAEAVRTLARSVTHTEVFGLRQSSHKELAGIRDTLYASNPYGATNPEESLAPGSGVEEFKEEEEPVDDVSDAEEEKDIVGEHDELDPIEAGFNVETGASVTDAMMARLNRQFKPQGVEILDVIIEEIKLPGEIQDQMSQKTMVISQNAEQRMQQKYDLLMLNQGEAIKTLRQSHTEMKMEAAEDGNYNAILEGLKLELANAEGKRIIKNIKCQMNIDVSVVDAESELAVQRINDRAKLETEKVREGAERDAALIEVDAQTEERKIRAQAELKCAELSAKGEKAVFHAEGVSAPMNRALNEQLTSLKKLEAQQSLANNGQLIVTGTSGGEAANRLILAEAALEKSVKTFPSQRQQQERSSILSEIAVASGKAQIRLNLGNEPTA
uniref:Band 7 domain-containing protein n=1 Tax=Helicotheca tamesis TaxID=374047 RepID=A0A7S2IFT9_9STRA|mmetsp:Transcript_8760/g.12128  ORF Transcript_8760/g.12128 Transcript_8760/m.12128 type:complete len:540 (+) Transcript_8760:112-1731(+)|eukprot:CAMPEP_0185730506 /NCGR_PEP_ID=MMETSP1171-20130828/10084_1 /TAXON_ID=374046 /ORGANISM="Helicotheca tamensis, Strain CCMP826" /LENGTH=539 /DNA_ID=CAMNT_0028399563 /DNA_START=81 /DNA_END=1700 /DNA_ORIENTATION=-